MREKMKHWKKISRTILPCAAAVLFVVVVATYFYYRAVLPVTEGGAGTYFSAAVDMETSYSLTGQEVIQEYTSTRDRINRIGVCFLKQGDVTGLTLHGELKDRETGEVLETWQVSAELLTAGGAFDYFTLADPAVGKGRTLEISLSTQGNTSGGELLVCGTSVEKNYGKLTAGNREEAKDSLAIAVVGPVEYVGKIFWAIAAGFVAMVILLFVWINGKKTVKTERVFLFVGGCIGAVYLLLFNPYSEPDGGAHVITSFYYADLLNGEEPVDETGKVLGRTEDIHREGMPERLGLNSLNTVKENFFSMEEETDREAFFRGKLKVPFTAHLPQILGTALGMAAGLGAIPTLYLGKLFALFFYLGCCYWGIKWMPFGKMVLFCTALLPFSLETATSYSYDNTVLALAVLMTGFVFYLKYEKTRVSWKEVAFWMLLTMWLSPCKIVYCFLGLLIFLVPGEKFGKKRNYWLAGGGTLAAAGASLAFSRMATISDTVTGEMGDYFTIPMFFEDLFHSLLMIGKTIEICMDEFFQQIFGGVFSWFDVKLAWSFVICYFVLLCMAGISNRQERVLLKPMDKAGMGVICLLVIAAIAASMLFTWTPKDSEYITGIQGRYFLPVLPLCVFLFQNRVLVAQKRLDRLIITGMVLVQFMTVMQLFTTIINK